MVWLLVGLQNLRIWQLENFFNCSYGTLGRRQGTAQAAVIKGPFQVLIAGTSFS